MWTLQTDQMRPELIGRRQFSAAALALLGGATITIGCGGSSNSPTSPTSPTATVIPPPTPTTTPSPPGQTVGVVSSNHAMPHVAVLSAAQLSAGAGIILDISNGLHSHTVSLTSAQVTQIADKVRVFADSSTNPHSNGSEPHAHSVTFN